MNRVPTARPVDSVLPVDSPVPTPSVGQRGKVLRRIAACPGCREPLAWAGAGSSVACQLCGAVFSVYRGVPILVPPDGGYDRSLLTGRDRLRERSRGPGWLWRAWDGLGLKRVVVPPSPILRTNGRRHLNDFLAAYPAGSAVVEVGSKARRLHAGVINLDLAYHPEVDVIGDAHHLPFLTNSVDAVVITNVLEIAQDPSRVVSEIQRVLRPGGRVFAEMPFVQPYHPDPIDTHRFTVRGVRTLFSAYHELALGISAGPGSTLAWVLREYAGAWTSNFYLHHALRLAAGWLVFPLRYTDRWLLDKRYAEDLACAFYFVGEKSPG